VSVQQQLTSALVKCPATIDECTPTIDECMCCECPATIDECRLLSTYLSGTPGYNVRSYYDKDASKNAILALLEDRRTDCFDFPG